MTTKEFQKKRPLMIFLSYFKRHWKLFAVAISCAVLISAVDLAFPLVTRTALYEMLPNEAYTTFFVVMGIMLVAYALRSLFSFIVAYYGHTFGIRVEADIRADLFRKMQTLSYDFYDKNRTGQLMSRLTSDLFELTELAHHAPEDLLTSLLTIVGAMIVLWNIQWKLTLVLMLTIPVFVLVIMSMRRSMGKASRAVKQKTGHINAEIESFRQRSGGSKSF